MSGPNHGIAFRVSNVLAAVDTRWTLGNGHPHGDLPTSDLASAQPLGPRLLASKLLVQAASLGFISVDAQVNHLVADEKVPGNLLRARVPADIGFNAFPLACGELIGIAASAKSLSRFTTSLFGSVFPEPTAMFDLTSNDAVCRPIRRTISVVLSSALTRL